MWMHLRDVASVVLMTVVFSACSANPWQSPLHREHRLTGRIWDVAAARFVDRERFDARLKSADFILLGEKHDNPDHHRLQAEVLRRLIAHGRRPAVGFEMFDLDQSAAIAAHLARAPRDAVGLAQAVNWDKSGWPDWAMYQPIAEAALAAKLPIVATNLPSATARRMSRDREALDSSVRRDLGLDRPLSDVMFTRMAADIRNSHCGYGSDDVVEAMVEVQRARDAQMALSLFAAATTDGAVLIAGSGHARNDYGIPVYLGAKAPGKQIVSIALIEVDKQKLEPAGYALPDAHSRAPFDYLWFTPRVDYDDPCEKFKSQVERLKQTK